MLALIYTFTPPIDKLVQCTLTQNIINQNIHWAINHSEIEHCDKTRFWIWSITVSSTDSLDTPCDTDPAKPCHASFKQWVLFNKNYIMQKVEFPTVIHDELKYSMVWCCRIRFGRVCVAHVSRCWRVTVRRFWKVCTARLCWVHVAGSVCYMACSGYQVFAGFMMEVWGLVSSISSASKTGRSAGDRCSADWLKVLW